MTIIFIIWLTFALACYIEEVIEKRKDIESLLVLLGDSITPEHKQELIAQMKIRKISEETINLFSQG